MICRLRGELLQVENGRVELRCGDIVYELLVPAVDTQRLATMVGESAEFHTLHYLEGHGQGASYLPRLIGFQSSSDRAFFELFTTVKGLGNRKALRALQLPFASIAAAISDRDADLLKSLPEIGKRTAETIITELRGKIDRFVEVKTGAAPPRTGPQEQLVRDAVAVLEQLGENKLAARQLVERALAAEPDLDAADQLVAAAFRIKAIA